MIKVSVIIPVYGVEKYIERCARSLFEQTLDDIEYLFIDDCSPDSSIDVLSKILEEYPQRQSQVTIHRMDRNSGQAKVREWGMRNATGEYIIHCDSDDWTDTTQYEKMYETAINERADIVFCDFYQCYPDGAQVVCEKNVPCEDKYSLLGKMLSGYHSANQLWSCLVKRTLLDNIIYPEGNLGEDRVTIFQLVWYSKKMVSIKEPLYYYFMRPGSISRMMKPENLIDKTMQSVKNVETILEFLHSIQLDELYKEQIVYSKFNPRVILAIGLHNKRCRNAWYTIYPEINGEILKNKYISQLSKFKEIIMRMHLGVIYGYLYLFKQKITWNG